MEYILNAVEVRVIGSLIEKELTTPEYHPLTMNSLLNACNQLSNRDPVVSYDEKTVTEMLFSLRGKGFARMITGADNRVPKYQQIFTEKLNLSDPEIAVMCVLMLRGPQTVGELRGRTGRLYEFKELQEVDQTLQGLIEKKPDPLIVRLPRQPGTKESRFQHLLSGEVKIEEMETPVRAEPTATGARHDRERISQLELEVASLRQELTELKLQFTEFRKQFE